MKSVLLSRQLGSTAAEHCMSLDGVLPLKLPPIVFSLNAALGPATNPLLPAAADCELRSPEDMAEIIMDYLTQHGYLRDPRLQNAAAIRALNGQVNGKQSANGKANNIVNGQVNGNGSSSIGKHSKEGAAMA
jgi:hypothetical protein